MSIVGLLATFFAAISYSLRFSYIKDLNQHVVSKTSLNFWYRVFSLPVILVFIYLSGTVLYVEDQFWIWLVTALIANTGFGLYQVHILQKHSFSSVESLSFLGILFTTLAGFVFLNEVLTPKTLIGITVICLAFIFLAIKDYRKGDHYTFFEIVLYSGLSGLLNIVNKQAVLTSSPTTYVVAITMGAIAINYLITIFRKSSLYKLTDPKANRFLIGTGVFTASSFIGISYGYKLLPVGLVATIISLRAFISLWLAKKKYNEVDLFYKYLVSAIAFIGVIILAI